jgi:hypothetical protein
LRIVLRWIDQLRRTTVDQLPAFCAAVVAQFQEIAAAANAWAAMDHNSDGTHQVVKIGGHDTTPEATVGRLTVYWDGTNLKYVKPDGTTGNIV